jgi:hypothetical protein
LPKATDVEIAGQLPSLLRAAAEIAPNVDQFRGRVLRLHHCCRSGHPGIDEDHGLRLHRLEEEEDIQHGLHRPEEEDIQHAVFIDREEEDIQHSLHSRLEEEEDI